MNRPKVLVADSERDSADTLAAFLGANRLVARAVYDGREAIELASQWVPDGAVVDLELPRASGYDVAKSLRENFGRRVRLVAFTAWTQDAIRDRARRAGFDDVLVKPSQPERILESLSPEGMVLVKRSAAVIVTRLGLMIDLGESLLDFKAAHRGVVGDPRAVSRIVEFVRLELRNSTLAKSDREELDRRLKRLAGRAER